MGVIGGYVALSGVFVSRPNNNVAGASDVVAASDNNLESSSSSSLVANQPWKVQIALYWLCLLLAKGIAENPLLPSRVKSSLIPFLVKLSSTILGHQSTPDKHLGCSTLAKAIMDDDVDLALETIKEYPEAITTRYMGIIPLEHAVQQSAFRVAAVLIDTGKQNPHGALRACRSISAVQFLVSKGAVPSLMDAESYSPVDHMAVNGWIEAAETMIKLGAEPSPTVLRMLRHRGHGDIADKLLELISALRKEKREFAGLVLLRKSPKIFHNDLVRECIFQFADIDKLERC